MEVWLHQIVSMTLIDLFLMQNQGYSQLEMFYNSHRLFEESKVQFLQSSNDIQETEPKLQLYLFLIEAYLSFLHTDM